MSAVSVAFDGIRQLIACGELSPGDKLPPEAELTQRFGVSRSSLREAMTMLTAVGILDAPGGSSRRVSALKAEQIFTALSLTVDLLPLDSFLEIYHLRKIVETAVCELAVAHATTQDIAELQRLASHTHHCPDPQQSTTTDHMFHRKIAELSGNPAISAFLESLRNRSQQYDLYGTQAARDFKAVSDQGHQLIVEAFVRKDPALAATAMAQHIEVTYQWLVRYHPEARDHLHTEHSD